LIVSEKELEKTQVVSEMEDNSEASQLQQQLQQANQTAEKIHEQQKPTSESQSKWSCLKILLLTSPFKC